MTQISDGQVPESISLRTSPATALASASGSANTQALISLPMAEPGQFFGLRAIFDRRLIGLEPGPSPSLKVLPPWFRTMKSAYSGRGTDRFDQFSLQRIQFTEPDQIPTLLRDTRFSFSQRIAHSITPTLSERFDRAVRSRYISNIREDVIVKQWPCPDWR